MKRDDAGNQPSEETILTLEMKLSYKRKADAPRLYRPITEVMRPYQQRWLY